MSEDDIREYAELLAEAERLRTQIAKAKTDLAYAQNACQHYHGLIVQFGSQYPSVLASLNAQLERAMGDAIANDALLSELEAELVVCGEAIASF